MTVVLTDRSAVWPFQFDARQPPVQFIVVNESFEMSRAGMSVPLSPAKSYEKSHSRVPVPPTSFASPPLLRDRVGRAPRRPDVSRRSSSENSTVMSIACVVVVAN